MNLFTAINRPAFAYLPCSARHTGQSFAFPHLDTHGRMGHLYFR
jgi:hypothetical protein